jgi:acetyltransferase-like isoleucine patch superfamily enzyme
MKSVKTQRLLDIFHALAGEGPSYLFYYLFSWIYSTWVLRYKAAASPYPHVRHLLLKRSGVIIGESSRIGFGVLILSNRRHPPSVTFGKRAAVAPYVIFVVSSYPDDSLLNNVPDLQNTLHEYGPIHVEDDAWIGASAVILPGITIGQGAVIGAGAVVTKDIPSYTIVAGIPAMCRRRIL